MAENIVLNPVATFTNDTTAVNTVNGNNTTITNAFVDCLSRSGASPNQMGSPLDMNSWPIINLPAPGTANSPARLIDVTSTNPIAISVSLTGDITAPASSGVLTTTINKTPTNGNLLVANGSSWNSVVPSGDWTISNSGVATISNNAVSNAKFRQGSARTVVGVTGNATSNVADIQGTARQVLAVNTAGTALAFAQPQGDQLLGTITNDSASAGNVGEFITATLSSGSAIALTTNVPSNVTSISLTAGDWDVWGFGYFSFAGTTSYTNLQTSVSATSAVINQTPLAWATWQTAANVPTAANPIYQISGPIRLSFAAPTTVFLVSQATFTVSTLSAFGCIAARRVR